MNCVVLSIAPLKHRPKNFNLLHPFITFHSHITAAAMSICTPAEATHSATFEWHPADLIHRRPQPQPGSQPEERPNSRFALIVLNQPVHDYLSRLRQLWDNGILVLALLTEL